MAFHGYWTPPVGYKGLRTGYRHACRVRVQSETSMRLVDHRTKISEMEEWCEEHCKFPWSNVEGCWWFDKTNEAIMFKMVWGGK